MTREDWLNRAVELLRPQLQELARLTVPPVRVSCGDLGLHKRSTCYPADWTVQPGVRELVISLRHTAEAIPVLGSLTRELIHAAGIKGHYRNFQRAAAACGLRPIAGPWATAGFDPGDPPAWAYGVAQELPPWPAPRLQPPTNEPKQTTRMLGVTCEGCGMKWRAAGTHLHNDLRCPQPDCGGTQHVAWTDASQATTAPENRDSVTFRSTGGITMTAPWRVGKLLTEQQAQRIYDALRNDEGVTECARGSATLVEHRDTIPGVGRQFRIAMTPAPERTRRLRVRKGAALPAAG